MLVAGTNGKGSTASALASVLIARPARARRCTPRPTCSTSASGSGSTGAWTTAPCSSARLERDWETWERFELSFFEAATALAFARFRDAGVEVAVLEVGLGGRLDATNTVEPILSVITSLGMDHAHILGSTAAAIAPEKAGILRAGIPAVIDGRSRTVPPRRWRRARARWAQPLPAPPLRARDGGRPLRRAAGVRFRLAPRPGGSRWIRASRRRALASSRSCRACTRPATSRWRPWPRRSCAGVASPSPTGRSPRDTARPLARPSGAAASGRGSPGRRRPQS